MKLTIDTDKETDQCYLAIGERVLEKGVVASTLRVTDDVMLDFDSEGRLIGIDVLNASTILGDDYDTIQIDSLVGVKEAAALVGVRPSNFVRDHASSDAFPAPVAELSSGRIWLSSQVRDYAATRQREERSA